MKYYKNYPQLLFVVTSSKEIEIGKLFDTFTSEGSCLQTSCLWKKDAVYLHTHYLLNDRKTSLFISHFSIYYLSNTRGCFKEANNIGLEEHYGSIFRYIRNTWFKSSQTIYLLKIMSILGRFMDEILFDICRRRRMKIQKQKIQSTAQNNLSKVWFLSYIILLILFLILYIATVDCEKIAKSIVCHSIVDCWI